MHTSPRNGFPSNKFAKNQLDLKVNKINLNFSEFNDYKWIIQELNENFKEIEAIRNDPEDYIDEYFSELTRQVDMRRETLIEDIHIYSNRLILKIEKLKQDCVAKSRETTKITDDLDTIKAKINDLNSMFNSLEIDDIKLEEIMSQKKSKEISDLNGPVFEHYKFQLQGNRYYKLITKETKLEDIFGSLGGFDCDIDNMKVNVVCCLQYYFFEYLFTFISTFLRYIQQLCQLLNRFLF